MRRETATKFRHAAYVGVDDAVEYAEGVREGIIGEILADKSVEHDLPNIAIDIRNARFVSGAVHTPTQGSDPGNRGTSRRQVLGGG